MPQVIPPADNIIRHNFCGMLAPDELEEVSDCSSVSSTGLLRD
jgi:hypothetical protein